jgi:hypothetical protein
MEAADVKDLMVEMTPSVSIPQLGSEFDDFLFAPVGGDVNGMTVSVLSALARLDVDPWQEAANLARLPGATAIERLTSLLMVLPGGISANPDPRTIAARLIALLPRRTGRAIASRETRPNTSRMTNFPTVARMVVINVLIVAFMVGAQWIVASNQPPTRVADGHVAAPDTNAAQAPSRISGQ